MLHYSVHLKQKWSWTCVLWSVILAVYAVYVSQKEEYSFSLALWDADPGLRVHSAACGSCLSCITHITSHHIMFLLFFYFNFPLCSFWVVFFCLFFQSCMLICWLSFHFSVDVWSVGCIMAEMVRGSVLFPGTDRILKLNLHPNPPKCRLCLILLSDILFMSLHTHDGKTCRATAPVWWVIVFSVDVHFFHWLRSR